MVLSKNQFFLLLLAIIVLPFLILNAVWFYSSEKITGTIIGIGHYSGMGVGQSSYSLVLFIAGKDTVSFQAADENFKEGDKVPVRYLKKNPSDCKLNTPLSILNDNLPYMAVLLIFWIVVYIKKDIVPWNAQVKIGGKPFLKVISRKRML